MDYLNKINAQGKAAGDKFVEAMEKVAEALTEAGQGAVPENFTEQITEEAVELLKELVKTGAVSVDETLILMFGNSEPIDADSVRMSTSVALLAAISAMLDDTVEEIQASLLKSDEDLFEILPALVTDLCTEATAVALTFDNLENTFDDAANLLEPAVELLAKEKDKDAAEPRRTRRSPRWNRPIGGGWSVGLNGLNWSNSRGNIHFNARPTFGSGGFGGRASLRIEF